MKPFVCKKPFTTKEVVQFMEGLTHAHNFIIDTIKEREGVFNTKDEFKSVKDKLVCMEKIE